LPQIKIENIKSLSNTTIIYEYNNKSNQHPLERKHLQMATCSPMCAAAAVTIPTEQQQTKKTPTLPEYEQIALAQLKPISQDAIVEGCYCKLLTVDSVCDFCKEAFEGVLGSEMTEEEAAKLTEEVIDHICAKTALKSALAESAALAHGSQLFVSPCQPDTPRLCVLATTDSDEKSEIASEELSEEDDDVIVAPINKSKGCASSL
jgi:hypothetical protein